MDSDRKLVYTSDCLVTCPYPIKIMDTKTIYTYVYEKNV